MPCGRSVEVPPLHELRIAAGQDVLSPVIRVQSLLLRGELPGTRNCAVCHRETDGRREVSVECERAVVKAGGPSRADVAAGCLLSFGLGALLQLMRRTAAAKELGSDVAVVVPLPVCDACLPVVDGPGRLRQALRQIPEYAALLDRYPDAVIVRRG